MELQQMIYSILRMQIQFGVYRAGERLPTIEDACRLFGVSAKTIRGAYQHLQQEGLISISKSIGVKVKAAYSEADFEKHVQKFFSARKDALLDASLSLRLLFSGAQWRGFQHVPPEHLDTIEELAAREDILAPHKMILHLYLIYGALQNDMLMRLVWQFFLFFYAPFFSVPGNLKGLEPENSPLHLMVCLCRQQDWDRLRTSVEAFQERMVFSLHYFYENRITGPVPTAQQVFTFSSYKKASQRCYSLAMEILFGICWGDYPAGTMLPPMKKLAEEKQVSVITIRRTLSLLCSIGAAKTINGVGTQILSLPETASSLDCSQSAMRNRLLDFVQSLQVLAMSCRQVAAATFSPGRDDAIEQCRELLLILQREQRCELAPYGIVNHMARLAPFQTVRTVYASLFQQLLWGHPVRIMRGSQQSQNQRCLPHLDYLLHCLSCGNAAGFAERLEQLLLSELHFSAHQLAKLGLREAAVFALPEQPGL